MKTLLIIIAVIVVIIVALYYIIIYAITDENGNLEINGKFSYGQIEVSTKNGKILNKISEDNNTTSFIQQ